MGDRTALGHWVRRFLMEYAAAERNLSPNTCASYRDMLVLLLPFAARRKRAAVDELVVTDLSADVVRTFLTHLERDRQCSIATRKQRLASVHALARFIGERSPQHVEWAAQLRMIPIKKGVTATRHPTAEWLAQQIVEAFPWETAPTYLVRDNDGAYGPVFARRVRAMGIRDRSISPRSPWQNPYAERLIGTLRRDCLDHVLIFGARHLRWVLTAYSGRNPTSDEHGQPIARAIPSKARVSRQCLGPHSVRRAVGAPNPFLPTA